MVRFKNRYLVFELDFKDKKVDESLGELTLLGEFRAAVGELFGQFALGSILASLQVKYFNPVPSMCLLRCSREDYRKVWISLTLLTELKKRAVAIRLLHVSGSLEPSKEFVKEAVVATQKGRKCNAQHQKLMDQAAERLEAVET